MYKRQFLYRYAGEPAVLSDVPHFADVTTTHPFFDEIQWMFESGNATGERKHDPLNAPVVVQNLLRFVEPCLLYTSRCV